MNRLNRKLEYALMALKHMSEKPDGQLTSTKEVCAVTGCPFDATARVMQVMANKGLLKSEQGVRGGYLIFRNLEGVSFHELIEMIQGPMDVAKCIKGGEDCELLSNCNIRRPLDYLNQKIYNFYNGITLAEVLMASATSTASTKGLNESERQLNL